MDVGFRTNELRRCFEEHSRAERKWGRPVGRTYVQRIEALLAASDWSTVRRIQSLRAHQLKGKRKGEWALDLNGPWRLVVTVAEDESTVTVREVTNHYED